MKITRIDAFRYDLFYKHGSYTMSHGRVQAHEPSLVVKLTTDEGLVGWAETAPHGGTYLPSFFDGEVAALNLLATAVLGCDPCQPATVQVRMAETLLSGMAAKCAIDVACWDVLGKAADLPVAHLLGGFLQDDIPVWEVIPLGAPQDMADFAASVIDKNPGVFQMKVGDDPYMDARRVGAVMDVVGTRATVVADANGGWNLQRALTAVRAMEGHPIVIEQPCRSMANCAEVRRHTNLPMVLDEIVNTVEDLVAVRSIVRAGGINLKPSRVGGITPARVLRDMATELGMMVTIDDTWGGALAAAALSHLAFSTKPDALLAATYFSDLTQPSVATPLNRGPSGRGLRPQGPGLGIVVDEAALGAAILTVT